MRTKISLIIVAVLLISFSLVSLGAVVTQQIEAYRADDMKFRVDGKEWQPRDLDGSILAPIIYNGRSYVPVRALLEEKDVEVDFDDKTRTIVLDYPDYEPPVGEWDPPKDKSRYWDPNGDTNPDIGDIISGPIVWQIGGPYEELPDYTLLIELAEKLKGITDSSSTTFNVSKDTMVMVNGKEWNIADLTKQRKSFIIAGELDGQLQIKGDKMSNEIKYIAFDGEEMEGKAEAAKRPSIEVSFSGPPLKITITIRF